MRLCDSWTASDTPVPSGVRASERSTPHSYTPCPNSCIVAKSEERSAGRKFDVSRMSPAPGDVMNGWAVSSSRQSSSE